MFVPRLKNQTNPWLLLGILLALGTMISASATGQMTKAGGPANTQLRPLDPLTPEERAYTERLARADARVKEMIGEAGVRMVSVELAAIKPESLRDAERMVRHAEVVLFHPESDAGAKVLVNLQQKTVVQASRLTGEQVPMTSEDLAEAYQLAQRDAAVEKFLGESAKGFQMQPAHVRLAVRLENEVTGLRVRGKNQEDPCAKHRCLELFFRRGRDYLSEQSVVVDLTAKHVYVERSSHETH